MSFFTGAAFQNLCRSAFIHRSAAQITFQRPLTISSIDLAARKGTREKARKNKVKAEVKTYEFVPKKQRLLLRNAKNKKMDKHLDDENKVENPDLNVYRFNLFKRKTYTFGEALDYIKEYNHPTMFNALNVPVFLVAHLNIQGEKKTRFMEEFHRTALVPHGFQKNERRTILVFSKDAQVQKEVIEAGATKSGGTELIKAIQLGELKISNYEYIIAQNSMLTDIIPLRGLLKKRFPSAVSGTLADDLVPLVTKFLMGVQYKMVRDIVQPNFGTISTSIGTLDMDPVHLEENAAAILQDVNAKRPKREGPFITNCFLKGYPHPELFKIDPFLYVEKDRKDLGKSTKSSQKNEGDDDAEEAEKDELAASN